MAVDVMDDMLDADYGYGMYGGDCLQIAFSEYGDDYGAEYGFSNYNGHPEIWRWYDGNAALEMQSVQFKTVRDEETGHTRYEIAFPWQSIFAAKPDGSFYMTMLAGDRDGGSSKATLEWRAGIGNGKKAEKAHAAHHDVADRGRGRAGARAWRGGRDRAAGLR